MPKNKPRLLDLFCGAGGAAMGYHRAGFEVVGIDIKPQPHFPFEFHCADALTYPLDGFDAYHASPPCQGYSATANLPWLTNKEYPLLILPTRLMFQSTGKPFVIENVKRAKVGCKQLTSKGISDHGMDAGLLCGCMFDYPFFLERLFETNFLWWQPVHKKHNILTKGRMFGSRLRLAQDTKRSLVPWMDKKEASQAIPPAYTEYIGLQLNHWRECNAIT